MTELGELETDNAAVVRQLTRIADALEDINDTLEALTKVIMEFE